MPAHYLTAEAHSGVIVDVVCGSRAGVNCMAHLLPALYLQKTHCRRCQILWKPLAPDLT